MAVLARSFAADQPRPGELPGNGNLAIKVDRPDSINRPPQGARLPVPVVSKEPIDYPGFRERFIVVNSPQCRTSAIEAACALPATMAP